MMALIVPPLIAAILTYGMIRSFFLSPAQPASTSLTIIEIAQGKGLSHIAAELKEKGIIKSSK